MADLPEQQTAQLVAALRGVLSQVAEPTLVLRTILEQAVARTGADRGLFVEVAEGGRLDYRVLHNFQPRHLEGESGSYSRHLFARVLETGDDVMLDSVTQDPFFANLESIQALRTTAILCVPITAGGRIAALVHLENRKRGHFTPEHRELMHSLLAVASPLLEALQAGRNVIGERDRLKTSESHFRHEAEESRKQLAAEWSFGRFVGRSAVVRELERAVRRVAASDFPVLLLGETGTGKNILARVLHYAGPRAQQSITTVFCPSLEKGMVEAELFGHKKGAFTGALSDRTGRVQAADKGTLFLDEIGELPLELQPKLLRLLQEKTYERVGDVQERHADVRIIAATNRDLDREVREGRFRRDLFERLNYVPIRVPPLRERTEDIPLLLRHALDQTESGRWVTLSAEGERFLSGMDFAWPGNVRHIEQLAARLTLEDQGQPVGPQELLRVLDRGASPADAARAGESRDLEAGLPALLQEAERAWLEEALRRYPEATRAELAGVLKISESALYKKLRQYGLGA
jgi:transcriptional regulator with GAF, ATPase, and Fis domain